MQIKIDFSRSELNKINQNIAKLGAKEGPKAVKKAIRKGGNRVRKAMRANAPLQEGTLKKSIKSKSRSRRGTYSVRVGTDPKVFPHAYLVEFGHRVVLGGTISSGGRVRPAKNRDRTGRGRVVGFAQPKPFARTTYSQIKNSVIEQARQDIIDSIEASAARMGKK